MARLWIVLVLFLAQNVFANFEDHHESCDFCIRSGRRWCHSKKEHCIMDGIDDGCPNGDYEELNHIITNTDGDLLKPMYAERTLYLEDRPLKLTLSYPSSTKRNVTTHFKSKETNDDPKIDMKVINSACNASSCTVDIFAKAAPDFCSFFSTVDIVVKVDGFTDEATIKYHVQCSCECTSNKEIRSAKCNNHGNYTCGICSCEPEWTGDLCEESCTRGDQEQECMNMKHDELLECSGNGKCACDKCKCYDDREGSQYFDPYDKCSDICMQTIECHSCLRNGTVTDCPCDGKLLTVLYRNETLATTQMDTLNGKNRKVWVHCQETAENCDYDYYAMKYEDDSYYIMMNSNCNNFTAGLVAVAGSGSNVPLILGILGIIAVVATVGGILLWKHLHDLPPLPLTDPQYANIDAEDCTGENPLYKPPTSSFKNPTYGKW